MLAAPVEEGAAVPVWEPWKPAPESVDCEEPVEDEAAVVRVRVGRDMVVLRLMDMPVPMEPVPVAIAVALRDMEVMVMEEAALDEEPPLRVKGP